jgi:hypothetical protein
MKKKVPHKKKIARGGLRTLGISLFREMRSFDSPDVYHSSGIRAGSGLIMGVSSEAARCFTRSKRELMRERLSSGCLLPKQWARK